MKCKICKSKLNNEAVREMKEKGLPFLCGFCDGTIDTMILNGELPPRK